MKKTKTVKECEHGCDPNNCGNCELGMTSKPETTDLDKIKAVLMDLAAEVARLKEVTFPHADSEKLFTEISEAINEIGKK